MSRLLQLGFVACIASGTFWYAITAVIIPTTLATISRKLPCWYFLDPIEWLDRLVIVLSAKQIHLAFGALVSMGL